MRPDKLVMMANQIAAFFAAQGEARAVPQIADHVEKFWDPRMRPAQHAPGWRGACWAGRGWPQSAGACGRRPNEIIARLELRLDGVSRPRELSHRAFAGPTRTSSSGTQL